MRLLLCLAQRPGEVVSIEDLLREVWSGVIVSPDSVYQAIALLRRLLGDDPKQPAYISTVPRLGYRMVASVSPWVDKSITPTPAPPTDAAPPARAADGLRRPTPPRRAGPLLAGAGALCLALVLAFLLYNKILGTSAGSSGKSVAVLPFLDLTTQQMNEEYFADGMTEELIDRLSRIPGLQVPAPASSFYFKDKKLSIPEIAKSLGVIYVLSGSVRASQATLRIAVRLVRADDGYVIWSETYDRPSSDKLKVQDEIASEVAKALRGSLAQLIAGDTACKPAARIAAGMALNTCTTRDGGTARDTPLARSPLPRQRQTCCRGSAQ